jgi:D-serine deaminase-like pyridoxal phosphate-dependent protein
VTSGSHRYAALSRMASLEPPGGIATSFLAIDLEAMERNIRRMAASFAGRGASLRPHLKHHKFTEIALLQQATGASGMTCATAEEVAAAVGVGISDVLLANVVTDRTRLASVAKAADAAELASDAAVQHDVGLREVVEVDAGMRRSGVASADEAVGLAKHLALLPGLVFWGVMTYEGHLVAIEDRARRSSAVLDAFAMIPELLADLDRAGIPGARGDRRRRFHLRVGREPAVHDRHPSRRVCAHGLRVLAAGARIRARSRRYCHCGHLPAWPAPRG